MNNEPVALMTEYGIKPLYEGALQEGMFLYTNPHPDNLGLAESIIKQQELEIKRLKTIIEAYKIRPRGKSEFAEAILTKAQE